MFKTLLVITMVTGLFILAISAKAEARTHYTYASRSTHSLTWGHNGVNVKYGRRIHRSGSHKYRKHARRHRGGSDANGNMALAAVVTANGLVAKVAAPFQEKFQQFIKLVEADTSYPERPDLNATGNRISDIGCYTRGGHMPSSKHYRGLACDFDQTKRNVTSAFMYHVTPLAKLVGLTDGGTWPRLAHERHTGPDNGHIEVPTDKIPERTYAARRHHHKKIRYARR
jgi:hypothetical protein